MNKRKLAVIAGIPVIAAVAIASTATAATLATSGPVANPLYYCAPATGHWMASGFLSTPSAKGCPAGTVLHVTDAQGPQGLPGVNGSNGASAVTSISAATALSNWPDTGGAGDTWGLDNFTRLVNVTVENQVNNSHCNGAPVCYAVFGTISDNGTTVPQDGTAVPNNSEPGTITAAHITGISTAGQAEFQFYSTSNQVSAANVPAKDNYATQGKLFSTTNWGESAFPAGTKFFGVALTAYNWTYTAALSYSSGGTSVSCTQIWTDRINPGDDGQGVADGNITGTCKV